jgi:type I restriction enzyme S subunit
MSSKTKPTATKEEAATALVPKLRFPEFRKVTGWKERPLGNFLSESRLPGSKGNVAKKITVKLWGNGVFEKNDAIQGSINTQYFRRKAGQFIYSKLDFLNQAFGIIPPSLDNFESTVDLPCFDFADGLNPVFLLEYVKRREFYERLGETADGSRKARRIHAESFLSFPIALPSPAEQQKIAECLSSVDELIAAQARKLDALKTHKIGLMQQLFPREGETQPRLRFAEFQNAGEWASVSLGELGEIVTGKTPSTKEADLWGGDILFVTPTDISEDDKYQHTTARTVIETKSTKILPAGSVVYTCIASIGKMALTVHRSITNQQINAVVPNEKTLGEFIYYALVNLTPWIKTLPATNTLPIINKTDFSKIAILLPEDRTEQQRIADCLTRLDDLIAAQTQTLEALKTHKQGLMQQLFPSPEEVES